MTTHEGKARCPGCDVLNEAVSDLDGVSFPPKAGDASICAVCATLGVFTGHGNETRLPTEAEREALMADEDVRRAHGLMLVYKATR